MGPRLKGYCALFSKYLRSVLVSVRTSVITVKAAYFLKARFSSKLVFDLNGAMDTLQSELPKCMPDHDLLLMTKMKEECVAEYCPFANKEDCQIE